MVIDYAIRKIDGEGVKMTLLPNMAEAIALNIMSDVLDLARRQGYRVVKLDHNRWLAVLPGSDNPVEYKFLKVQREPISMAVNPSLVAFGSAH